MYDHPKNVCVVPVIQYTSYEVRTKPSTSVGARRERTCVCPL